MEDPTASPNWVPENFIVKLRKGDRYHYVFCEMVASCNYAVSGISAASGATPQLFSQETLDELIKNQQALARAADIEILDAVVLTEPGDGNEGWTKSSLRKQSATGQSGTSGGG